MHIAGNVRNTFTSTQLKIYVYKYVAIISINNVDNIKCFHLSDSQRMLTARFELRIMESIIMTYYTYIVYNARGTCHILTVWITTPTRT